MSCCLRKNNRGGESHILRDCLLSLALFCLLGPLTAPVWAEDTQVRPIRSVKLITLDEAGASIRYPNSLAYDPQEDEIYISSPGKSKLVITTADYFPYLSIGSGRGLSSVTSSYIKDGLLYVCVGASKDDPRPHIAVYDGAFLPQQKIYFPQLDDFSPIGLVIGATGKYYVTGLNRTGVIVLDAEGKFQRMIDPLDEVLDVKEKAPIFALDVDSKGRLYFLSESMGRVYVYDKEERFLYRFGEKGGEPGKLARPRGIAVDEFRRQVYIADYQRHSISVYAITGEYQFEFGGLGTGRGWFQYPSDILVDGQGRLLVADTFNHRIQVFEFVGGPPPVFDRPGELLAEGDVDAVPAPEPEIVKIGQIDVSLPADAKGDYLVLTSISRDAQTAQELAEKLRKKGYPVHIEPLDRGARGIWQQVLVGPYVDPLEAQGVAERLRSEELLPAILKTRGEPTELRIPQPQVERPAAGDTEKLAEDLHINDLQVAQNDSSFARDEAGFSSATAQAPVLTTGSQRGAVQAEAETLASETPDESPSFEQKPSNGQTAAANHSLPHSDVHAVVIPISKKTALTLPQPAEDAAPEKTAARSKPHPAKARLTASPTAGASGAALDNRAVLKQTDFCVECHDQRIAKVCLSCHPRNRRDRI